MSFGLFDAAWVFACGLSVCFSQPTSATEPTNWGPSTAQVQLSIGITNEVVTRGSNLVLYARIRNSSTNIVSIGFGFEPVYGFEVRIVDPSGTEYEPIPKAPGRMGNANGAFQDISPGNTFEEEIPIHCLNPELPPGKYHFTARHLLIPRRNGKLEIANRFELLSNPLPVQVK